MFELDYKLEKDIRNAVNQYSEFDIDKDEIIALVNKEGAVQAAKKMITRAEYGGIFLELFENNRLDLSIEAMVYENPDYRSLFNKSVLTEVKQKLYRMGYELKDEDE